MRRGVPPIAEVGSGPAKEEPKRHDFQQHFKQENGQEAVAQILGGDASWRGVESRFRRLHSQRDAVGEDDEEDEGSEEPIRDPARGQKLLSDCFPAATELISM